MSRKTEVLARRVQEMIRDAMLHTATDDERLEVVELRRAVEAAVLRIRRRREVQK